MKQGVPSRRAILSVSIGLIGTVAFGTGLSHVLDAGTCGSGAPFEQLQECPEDSSLWAILLPVGFVIWFVGLLTSREGLVEPGSGQITWTLFFTGIGLLMLFKALAQDLDADARLACYIVGPLLVAIGAAVGIAGLVQLSRRRSPPLS